MKINEDLWLAGILGCPAFRIDADGACGQPSRVAEALKEHTLQQRDAMYYAKVDIAQVEMVRKLCSSGFYVVDVNVTFGIDTATFDHRSRVAETYDCEIADIADGQEEAVLDIAATCFRYSRFHLDPLIDNHIANRIKREWVLSYVRRQRGERLLVAMVGEKPAGFLAVIAAESGDRSARMIDLVGVSEGFQRRGIGKALTASFIDHYRGRCDLLQVGTQAANIPSMRLYEKLGFSIISTAYVLHMHMRNGERV